MMLYLSKQLKKMGNFIVQRFMLLLRFVIGVFMVLMGAWFLFAPLTQQFLSKEAALQDAPYLWLIVPVGILQIVIGLGILRPVFKPKQ